MDSGTLSADQRKLLAALLEEEEYEIDFAAAFEIRGKIDDAPLSFAQQRLWFLNRMEPDSSAFNITGISRLKGPLDLNALRRAIEEIVRRHQILRAVFVVENGDPMQRFKPAGPMDLPIVDLSDTPLDARLAAAQEQCRAQALEPFDLENGPLIRLRAWRIGDEDHILLLMMHHIVSDGWSLGVFTNELVALYEAGSKGMPSTLPELEAQYSDYAIWQRKYLTGKNLVSQLEYWRRQLASPLPVLELPVDGPHPLIQTFNGSSEPLVIAQGLPDRLRALATREGATLFMVLMTAFQTLLARYSGQENILVGTPVAGRNRPETEPLIGLFLNTLVIRANLSGDPSFRELLGQVRRTCLDAFDHQDVPFERLVEEIHTRRDLSRSPLFQVMFILQVPNKPLAIRSLNLSPATVPLQQSKYELTFFLWEHNDRLEGSIEFNTDLFDAGTIRRMAEHFRTLLEGIAENPDRRLSELPLLRDSECDKIVREWNRTGTALPADCRLDLLIRAQALATPGSIAASFENSSITFGELERRSNQVARHLAACGVGPESLVAVCVERSLDMLVALAGVLKAGAAYIPLDPSYPPERIAYMLEDSGAQVAITQDALMSIVPADATRVIRVDADWPSISTLDDQFFENGASPDSAAYVIYTSGSTGRPKGVVISHRAMVNFVNSMRREPGFCAQDKILAVTTLSFDIAGLELLLPLATGGRIEIASRADAMDGRRLAEMIDDGVTIMQATPATWRLLISSGWQGRKDLKILCGGEALSRDLADQLLDRSGELWNMYGPTETTVWSTIHKVARDGPILIGHPIDNTSIYILDERKKPVPIGVVGELWIGGTGLARGYLNRPELTAEKFVCDPFSFIPGARMYRTGDLARFRFDSGVECRGRIDGQVKVRGFRIETGEVEVALRQQPGVLEACVVARPDSTGENRLVAYVVPAKDGISADWLRACLKPQMPEYMIPSALVTLNSLPLTPNGKVDRRALPDPDETALVSMPCHEPPHSGIEQTIAEIWAEVLGTRSIGRDSNFFDLGGHSLLLARVHVTLEARLQKEFDMIHLFRFPTVSSLAAHLSEPVDSSEFKLSRRRGSRRAAAVASRTSAAQA